MAEEDEILEEEESSAPSRLPLIIGIVLITGLSYPQSVKVKVPNISSSFESIDKINFFPPYTLPSLRLHLIWL